jgi:RNA polymerase sigma-70 factor (ECF subfamily)
MTLEQKFEEATGYNFNKFYTEQKPKLTWYLSNWTKCLSTAEDFADEAFMKALKSIDSWDSNISQIQTWIYTIAINFVKKEWQDNQKKQLVSIDKQLANDVNLSMFIPIDDDTLKETREKELHKKSSIIKNAIYSMPDKQSKYRTVLILREIENMSYSEISEYLNINPSTIKSQIKKGREIICKKVEKELKYIDENGLV